MLQLLADAHAARTTPMPPASRNFPVAERAKRHLIVELDRLGFPVIGKDAAAGGDPVNGLCFDLLSSTDRSVMIGHDDGVITIDLAESDPAYRERLRGELDEPYRTMLGHFRHEIGHYYEWQLVEVAGDPERIARVPRAVRRRDRSTIRPRSTGTTRRVRRRAGSSPT